MLKSCVAISDRAGIRIQVMVKFPHLLNSTLIEFSVREIEVILRTNQQDGKCKLTRNKKRKKCKNGWTHPEFGIYPASRIYTSVELFDHIDKQSKTMQLDRRQQTEHSNYNIYIYITEQWNNTVK